MLDIPITLIDKNSNDGLKLYFDFVLGLKVNPFAARYYRDSRKNKKMVCEYNIYSMLSIFSVASLLSYDLYVVLIINRLQHQA